MSKIKNPYIHSILAELYILLVVLVIHFISKPNTPDTIFDGLAFLSMFVLSAAVMGYLFLSEPLQLYLSGEKKAAVSYFMKTVVTFAVITIITLLVVKLTMRPFDPKNSSFSFDGAKVTLHDGFFEQSLGGGESKMTVRYFGNDAKGDLNGDGKEDAAFLFTKNSGGSGTYFYVIAALATKNGYETTNEYFLGDRIAPQSTEIKNGELIVNYAVRKEGDPMTTQPSVGQTLVLHIGSDGYLIPVMK